VLLALEGKFFVVELEYLAGFLLPVEEILHARLRGLQLLHLALKLCNTAKVQRVRLPLDLQQLPDKSNGVPLFLLRRILFFRTKSSPFACNSWTSL
jgi:hypothetical protein